MNDLLTSERIKLRALEKEDLEYLYQWENDTRIWHLSNTRIPFSRYTLEEFIRISGKDIFEAGQLRLMIQLLATEKPIGAIDLFDLDPVNQRAGIGILISEDKNRQKGYASEALGLIIKYSSVILQLRQLYCNILENNENSLNLFINKGFVLNGAKKDWIKYRDEWLTEYFLQKIL